MQPVTKRVLKVYGAWVLLWVAIAFFGGTLSGHGEFGISAQLILSFTSFPFGFLSFHAPNGTVVGTAVAGVIGLVQWAAVAEINGRLTYWSKKRRENT